MPYFYIPEKIIEANGDIQDLKEIVDFKDYQIKSGIYLDKKNKEINQFKPKSDEIFIKPKLENQFLEDESAVTALKLQAINYPYVQSKPGSFPYGFLLKRENIQEKSLKNRQKEFFQTKIFNATKRIAEVAKFFDQELSSSDLASEEQTRERYLQKMKECLELLKSSKENNPENFTTQANDFYIAIKAQQNMIRHSSLLGNIRIKYEEIFDNLEKELESLKFKHDFQRLNYQFEINNESEYQILLKTDYLGGQLPLIKEILLDNEPLSLEKKDLDFKDWQGLLNRYFSKGKHQLTLILEEGPNLFGENWQKVKETPLENMISQTINNYEPDALYQLSFDYSAFESSVGFFFNQDYGLKDQNGQLAPLIIKILPQTKVNEFSHQDILIRAISFNTPAQISFFAQSMNGKSNQALFQNIKLVRVFEPMIVLKKSSGGDQTKITPNVSFTKINPTKYQVRIQGTTKPFNLVFNQSFNHGWRVYFKDSSKVVGEENHWLANGYANAWWIDPQGQSNLQLKVEYLPQKIYQWGLFLSAGIILFLVAFSLIEFNKRNEKEN